jgi:replicative DNA helicase
MTDRNILSMEPEIAVLSIIINNPGLVYNLEGLRGYMFSANTHQNIFNIIMDIGENNHLPDMAMILNYAVSMGKLDTCGGQKYIEYLKEQSYLKENLSEFVATIKNSYKVKVFSGLCSSVSVDTLKIDTVDESISQFQDNIGKLLTDSGGEGTYSVGSLVKDSFNEIIERINNPGIRGSSTGLKKVDTLTGGFDGGDLWYIGARPGMGKSALITCSALANAKAGVPSLIFSKEMTRQPLMERFLSIETHLPLFDIRMGILKKPDIDVLRDAAQKMAKYPIYIDLNFTSSMTQIESTIRKYHSLYDTRNVYIYYIQLLSERDADQTQELGRISRKMKLLSNQLDLTSIVLSQLNRDVEHRDNKRPVSADLRQCGNLEEDADFIIGLYRDEVYDKDTKDKGKMEFIILKQRNGPTGMLKLGFDGSLAKVSDD